MLEQELVESLFRSGVSKMVELREQLGALLRLEVKYAIRDYLQDLNSQNGNVASEPLQESTGADDSNETAVSQPREQISTCGEEPLPCATATVEADEVDKEKKDSSRSSWSATTCANSAVITEQHAVSWREKICEWSYQGE